MKKTLIIHFLLAWVLLGYSATQAQTIRNVNNNPANTLAGHYANIQDAVDAANPGDYIYVHGSPISYGIVNITKKLHFIGTGYNPNLAGNKQFPLISKFTNIYLSGDENVNASGSTINGLEASSINFGPWVNEVHIGHNNVGVIRLYYGGNYGGSNNTSIGNNIITGGISLISNIANPNSPIGPANVIIQNNIFSDAGIWSLDKNTLIINNIFIGQFENNEVFGQIYNAQISNNIFYGRPTTGTGGASQDPGGCVFSNNISFGTSNGSFSYGNNVDAGNNLVNVNPQFINLPLGEAFSYTHDYHLQAGSPGKNTGTDGTDRGIYGGGVPFRMGGVLLPQVRELNINNAIVAPGGTLQINFKAVGKQN